MHSLLSAGETFPGAAVPDNNQRGTDADWKAWIKQKYMSVAHPVGTAAMMKRSLGGQPFTFLSAEIGTQFSFRCC